jgi:hypothetical protein
MILPRALKTTTTCIKSATAVIMRRIDQKPTGSKRKKNKIIQTKKAYTAVTMNLPGSSAAYWPMELLRIQ